MGREKQRKTRLDKGVASGGDFVGFGAFAAPSTTNSLKASPVYTGSDSQLTLVFKRISQKRDGVTKARALNELESYFEQDHTKKEQVQALSHLVFLYHAKLHSDDFPAVRAAALSCMKAASVRLPKAWSSLVTEQQPEVDGMMWCAQADPASEVRTAAGPSIEASQDGVIAFVSRILSYDRPSAMHDALFARKQADTSSLSDMERDQLDERFERIVGTALSGMELWIQKYPETEENRYSDSIKEGILWKPLTRPKSLLRRKTYSLLATLCQHAKSLVSANSSTLPKLLTESLSQEKEAINIPPLIELFLLYLNSFPDNPWDIVDAELFAKYLGKQLKRACHGASVSLWGPTMLPLLATISDDTYTLQRQILANMWKGRDASIGPSNSLLIAAAVTECASFFLLRRENEAAPMEISVAQDFANTWLEALGFYLSTEAVSSSAKDADVSLLQTLSESWYKLDKSSCDRPNSAIYRVRDWFWKEALKSPLLNTEGTEAEQRLARILDNVMVHLRSDEISQSHGCHVVRERFLTTLSSYQGASGSVPNVHSYELMIATVRYCGARYIFSSEKEDGNTAIERFLMNDLLRWTVIHTSSLPARGHEGPRDCLARCDFKLLRYCLLCVETPHKQKTLWESMLREIVVAECDLGLLSTGLAVLLNETDDAESRDVWTEILRCETLEKFAIQAGAATVDKYRKHFSSAFGGDVEDESVDDDAYNEDARKSAMFLRTCVGLSGENSAILISQRVVRHWTDSVAPQGRDQIFQLGGDTDLQNPLADTLLSLVSKGGSLLTADDTEQIILESWRHGGSQWKKATQILLRQIALPDGSGFSCASVISKGADELKDLLKFIRFSNTSDRSHVALVCHVWAERAFRILKLCDDGRQTAGENELPTTSLEPTGLSNLDAWEASMLEEEEDAVLPLYFCLIYVLQQFQSYSDRLRVFLQSSDASSTLAMTVLLALSNASSRSVMDPMTRQDRRCAWLLAILGGKEHLPNELVQSWCEAAIMSLSSNMKSSTGGNPERVMRGVSILSELVGVLFCRLVPEDEGIVPDTVIASDVKEGDSLWYVTDKTDDRVRERAEVVKIHKDDFPLLYFSIRVERPDGAVQERQTVAERLRTAAGPSMPCGGKSTSDLTENERESRSRFAELVFMELVKPVLSSLQLESDSLVIAEAAAECASILISQCGLVGKGGLGTVQYDLFQLLSSLQSRSAEKISGDNPVQAVCPLRILSLAMGLGHVIPASTSNFKLIKLRPDESLKAISQFYEREADPPEIRGLDQAALEWLTVSICDVSHDGLRDKSVCLLYSLASSLMTKTKDEELNFSILVMRAVCAAQAAGPKIESDHAPLVFEGLIRGFASDWDIEIDHEWKYETLETDKGEAIHESLPVWHRPFQSLITTNTEPWRGLVTNAARKSADHLVENLFEPEKRWFALRLLDQCSKVGEPLHDDDEINAKTQHLLDLWEKDLLDEEAEELTDDVVLVSQWIPQTLMNELEGWDVDDEFREDESATCGRMLVWLSLLSFIDCAAAVDVRFRGSISAYLQKLRTVNIILSNALFRLEVDKDQKIKQAPITMEDVLGDPSCLEPSNLAALVLFRSVEVFPTHSKHWWQEDCPRTLSSAVCQFVETKVAPETLRRELDRINRAEDLGEMTVSGSVVSRQVTALYTQDECQLSIAIQIPPTFPLRNVEVDGSKTFGIIPEKWKRWALQIRLMLNNQDGTLLDALMLWKENVDKEFSGVEPCPVCYSILSVKKHELPNLECKTCQNRFHSSCLYTWFHSSGKSQCVLCQQPWSGTKIQKG